MGQQRGVAGLGNLQGSCVMGMGTLAIAESQALEQQINAQNGTYLEARCWAAGRKP